MKHPEVKNFIRFGLVIILIYLSYLVAKPYLTVIFISLVLAYMSYPLYRGLNKRIKNPNISAGILTLILVLAIMIPLVIMVNVLVNEAIGLVQAVQIDSLSDVLNERLNVELSDGLKKQLKSVTAQVGEYVFAQASAFVLSIPSIMLSFLIMLFVFYYAFKDGKKLLDIAKDTLPLGERQKKRLQKRFASTVESLVYGEVAISLLEGLVATLGFWILGVPSPVFWGVITGLVALLPAIGPTIIWAPIAIIFYLNGKVPSAILTALFGFFILTVLFDTIIRAKVLGIKGHIHPVIILVGVLGGLSVFGISGLVLGPLILVLLELVVEMYLESKHEAKSHH